MEYLVYQNEEQKGPFGTDEIQQMLRDGKITKDTLAWKEGMSDWSAIGEIIRIDEPETSRSESRGAKVEKTVDAASARFVSEEQDPAAVSEQQPSGIKIGLTPRQISVITWTVVSISILAGAIVTFLGIRGLINANTSADWPTAEGRVIQSEVIYHSRERGDNYYAEVSYEFTVDGVTFKGDRVAYGGRDWSRQADAERVVYFYPKGKDVTVYYMQGKPKKCLLEPGLEGRNFVVPSIGLFILLIGCVFACAPTGARRFTATMRAQVGEAGD